MSKIVCSKCGSSRICELQWHHVNDYVKVNGKIYHLMEEGNYFNTAYCDNDYQCLDCYDNGVTTTSGSHVETDNKEKL